VFVWNHAPDVLNPIGIIIGIIIFASTNYLIKPLISHTPMPSFSTKKQKQTDTIQVPQAWIKSDGAPKPISQKYEILTKTKYKKYHLPGLRTAKRLIAFVLLAFNFVISQVAWTSATNTQFLALFFLFNCFIILDYLWKTMKKPEVKT
jgi:hypothetical protein